MILFIINIKFLKNFDNDLYLYIKNFRTYYDKAITINYHIHRNNYKLIT